eukprot:COSAG01_NODE_5648_length_4118_cov_3.920129_3_plen_102_part_00
MPGDDSTFLIDRFETFLAKQIAAANPWLAHICFHAIHEPHPAMPVFWNMYATPGTNRGDPNYRGRQHIWTLLITRLTNEWIDQIPTTSARSRCGTSRWVVC